MNFSFGVKFPSLPWEGQKEEECFAPLMLKHKWNKHKSKFVHTSLPKLIFEKSAIYYANFWVFLFLMVFFIKTHLESCFWCCFNVLVMFYIISDDLTKNHEFSFFDLGAIIFINFQIKTHFVYHPKITFGIFKISPTVPQIFSSIFQTFSHIFQKFLITFNKPYFIFQMFIFTFQMEEKNWDLWFL